MNKEKLTSDGAIILLNDLGVKYVQCSYSGGGDSGSIDDWYFIGAEQEKTIDWQAATFINQDIESLDADTEEMKKAWSQIEDVIYNILNTKVNDWWNNGGGRGDFLLDTETCEYIVNNTWYITDIENETVEDKLESAE